jgi:hypothetical protein
MDRRRLLGTVGLAGIAALTGCLADGAGDETPDETTDTPTPQPTPMPTMTETEFTVRESRGGTQRDSATVSFDGSTVVVAGTIWGRDGCQTAGLDSATYDGAADELTVAVETLRRADAGDACTQAIVEIDYEATVAFDGSLPERVVVTHDRGGEVETVARVVHVTG